MTRDNNPSVLDIESLKQQHKQLDTRRTTARAHLATAQKQLEELSAEARKAWGTDNLDELRAKLLAMRQENEQKRAAYQKHLADVQAKLAEVERAFGDSNG